MKILISIIIVAILAITYKSIVKPKNKEEDYYGSTTRNKIVERREEK
jgi:hypothetical protein